MVSLPKIFSTDDLLIVFTYAPAGLGHLRVTDALYEALPIDAKPLILGATDTRITWLHRLTSIHPFLRSLMEWVQQGKPQNIFTKYYRGWLRRHHQSLYKQFSLLIDQYLIPTKTILVVATHFGLAHQLAVVKEKLAQEKKVKIILVVQVTDDSPQHIWLVPGADLIVVPSENTKQALDDYRREQGFRPIKIKTLPYPLSPKLMENLTSEEFDNKQRQLDPTQQHKINLAIPISGAAVGLNYFDQFITTLGKLNSNFEFLLASRFSAYTKKFIFKMAQKKSVQIYLDRDDHRVVNLYEQLYKQTVVSLEITKPSEQAFKVLLDPAQRGGAMMLFSQPVGRQEYDNLKFMCERGLIPNEAEQKQLLDLYESQQTPLAIFLEKIRSWRGVTVPSDPKLAAEFVYWLYQQQFFLEMLKYRPKAELSPLEVSGQGSIKFWEEVAKLLE